MAHSPLISIIVIVYDMADEAMNTVYSLSPAHQKNISPEEYEIIVVENSSAHNLDPQEAQAISPNVRYFLREEEGVSPVHAINFAFQQCQGNILGLMIDGARMVTPRVLEYVKYAQQISPHPLVAIPGYNLGPSEQQYADEYLYTKEKELQLLTGSQWKENGYRLFDISSIGGANPTGYIDPLLESNCVFASRQCFEKIGWADTQFTYAGGGSLNLHMFRSLGMLKETNHYFILPGEGSFHQMHGGVTTNSKAGTTEREEFIRKCAKQLNRLWGVFSVLKREPILLGAVTSHAQRFLQYSSEQSLVRFDRLDNKNTHHWVDDVSRQEQQ